MRIMRKALGICFTAGVGAAVGVYAVEHANKEPLHPLITDGPKKRTTKRITH